MPQLTKIHLANLRKQMKGNRIARAIELAGVTQQEVSHDLRCSQSYISDISRQRYHTVTVETAHRFARYFGVLIEDLFPPQQGDKRGNK